MADMIRIDGDELASIAVRMAQIQDAMQQTYGAVNQVQSNLNWDVRIKAEVEDQLQDVGRRLSLQKDKLAQAASVTSAAAEEAGILDSDLAKQAQAITLGLALGVGGVIAAKWNELKDSLEGIVEEIEQILNEMSEILHPSHTGEENAGQTGVTSTEQGTEYWNSKVGQIMTQREGNIWDGYSGQCVSYAKKRIAEITGITSMLGVAMSTGNLSDPAGGISVGAINYPSATENFLKKNGNIFENENGEKYQVTVTYDGVIRPNSVVSFGATAKNKYGHVAVVEAVQDEGGTQYVYFTEGNNSKIADGTLQKMELSKFLNYSGGYTGSVNYEKIS